MFSCVPHKKLLILKKSSGNLSTTTKETPYQVQNGDILSIKVSSIDPESVGIFNKSVGGTSLTMVNDASIYLSGYTVNDSGSIQMPLIGKLKVSGMTLEAIKVSIEEKLNLFFKHVSLDVKLMSFRITILGEANVPGTYTVYNENSTIFQLIGLAGGLTDYGNKSNIKIIRKVNGISQVSYIDINDEAIINSDFYYLRPNDLIYVEPLKAKALKVNSGAISIILSALTFIIVVANILSK
jgi:polysaccharide export outer membrane protein